MNGTAIRLSIAIILLVAASRLVGCIGAPENPSATQPATEVDLATTQPSYWYEQPGPTVRGNDFEQLWNVSERVARDFMFQLDRTDYRGGVLTTKPMTSRQWFEFWRRDTQTLHDVELTALATFRRTIR